MSQKRITLILSFFDAFGYNSGSSNLTEHWRALTSIHCVHIVLACFFSFYQIPLMFYLQLHLQWVQVLNQMMQYSAALYPYWLILMDSMLKKEKHAQFWKIHQEIHQMYCNQNCIRFRCFMLKFVVYHSITLIFAISFSKYYGSMDEHVLIYIVLMKLCQMRVFYYMFCVELIHFQLESILNALKMQRIKLNASASQSHQFKWIRGYYQRVFEMTAALNEVFGVSNVATVSFCFYEFLSDMNWLYTYARGSNQSNAFGAPSFIVFIHRPIYLYILTFF